MVGRPVERPQSGRGDGTSPQEMQRRWTQGSLKPFRLKTGDGESPSPGKKRRPASAGLLGYTVVFLVQLPTGLRWAICCLDMFCMYISPLGSKCRNIFGK